MTAPKHRARVYRDVPPTCGEAFADYDIPTQEQLDAVRQDGIDRHGFGSGGWKVVEDVAA